MYLGLSLPALVSAAVQDSGSNAIILEEAKKAAAAEDKNCARDAVDEPAGIFIDNADAFGS